MASAPPFFAKTKFAAIAEEISEPAFEVVDQTAGMQFGLTAQPMVFPGCGPPPRTSTVFCAASDAAPKSRVLPNHSMNSSFFIGLFSWPLRVRMP